MDIRSLGDEDIAEVVRWHGANAVIDALLTVAGEAYGIEDAIPKLHELVLRRAHTASV